MGPEDPQLGTEVPGSSPSLRTVHIIERSALRGAIGSYVRHYALRNLDASGLDCYLIACLEVDRSQLALYCSLKASWLLH